MKILTQIQSFSRMQRLMAGTLSVVLAGTPLLAAQDSSPAAQSQAPPQAERQQQAPPAQATPRDPRFGDTNTAIPDPSRGPQQPVQPSQAPTAVPEDQNVPAPPVPQTTAPPAATRQQGYQEPSGAAAAQRGVTSGAPASRPAGNAIAPAKQRQVHSLLIKTGAVLAGAAAAGTVYALSRGTSSVPPGVRAAAASGPGH